MTEIAIYGAGGFGREVNLIVQQLIKKGYPYHFLGFFDDEDKSSELGKLYLGNTAALNHWKTPISVALAIGNGKTRKKVVDRIRNPRVEFSKVISPYAVFNDIISIGKGSIICAGANLTTNIEVGEFVVVNLNATIGHDCRLGDFSSVMPGANLAGDVKLNEGAFVGSGATVLNGVVMERNTILGAGGVLTKNLDAEKTAVGVPAKTIEK
ncbi:serine O-acetyltransferase [Marivirga tractuosa]|uniref:Sugar O-acyltransferase, sialic acid O-acetyltransferase NeuD family n=1 Tax=Marivirga tractuosa (strain ATCC 23168 / DSM 4126 / NBRC 15989 / NCIMB 1408 / VKM B-1430 / H-43) TaxID=643867 RepID=E4TQ12_MARTH|nr:NeuD/PglB/VioB family sugar acetyltransferase [Marivirga tractuosa]ADR20569.1 sugar O-acyltransferase, sialic acid O-acetyltransferase NeuD family [Marivirga tractuosa DSM 4126]BDD14983.1 serine O-acetyltransferase [Marivirga tractuosa]